MAVTNVSPVARLHALWTLDGLQRLDSGLISKALDDNEPGVRENAIILAESRISASNGTESAALTAKLLDLVEDTSPKVRFQLLCTLGFVSTPAARTARDRLLAHDIEDRWVSSRLSARRRKTPLGCSRRPSPIGARKNPGAA
jgi:hypothetical protein